MFGFGRRKTRGQLVKAELGESLNHLRQAANHAANGVGPRVRAVGTPAVAKVRRTAANGWGTTVTTVGPLAAVAAGGARQAGSLAAKATPKGRRAARKEQSRRGPTLLTGLAIFGAAAAAGALIARRRRQVAWEEYDPTRGVESAGTDAETAVIASADDPLGAPVEPSTPTGTTAGTATGATAGSSATGVDRARAAGTSAAMGDAPTAAVTERAKGAADKSTGQTGGMLGRVDTAGSPNGRN